MSIASAIQRAREIWLILDVLDKQDIGHVQKLTALSGAISVVASRSNLPASEAMKVVEHALDTAPPADVMEAARVAFSPGGRFA